METNEEPKPEDSKEKKTDLNDQQPSKGYTAEEFDSKLNAAIAKFGISVTYPNKDSSDTDKPKTYDINFQKSQEPAENPSTEASQAKTLTPWEQLTPQEIRSLTAKEAGHT